MDPVKPLLSRLVTNSKASSMPSVMKRSS